MGGFILPFMEQCDYSAPMFDFRISGVSSLNVDMHKVISNYRYVKNVIIKEFSFEIIKTHF